jgi:hypothetical protein
MLTRSRPDQLNLPEDPAFIPDLDMNFDLAAFDIPCDTGTSRASSVLSARTLGSSQTSLSPAVEDEEPGLELPSMDTPGGFGGFDFNLGSGASHVLKTASQAGASDIIQESAIIENPGFEIAEDGSIVGIPSDRARQSEVPSAAGEGQAANESGLSARVRAEQEAGLVEDQVGLL